MTNDFLTAMQHTFLQRFFNTGVGQRFFLTDGTALAAFQLHHRLSKDFVDLYFILQTGYGFEELFAMAQQKDLGLLEFYFAGALLQVNRLTRLPRMKKSLDLPTLQAFFTSIAEEMLDRLNPDIAPPPLKPNAI